MKLHRPALALLLIVSASSSPVWAAAAHDDASQPAYSDGWDDGDNGGFGFGPWSLSFNGDASELQPVYNSDPHFIDGVGIGPLNANLLGAPAFGLTTDTATTSATASSRPFSNPFQIGQTFSVDIDGSALEGEPRIGNLFELVGADGVARYTLRTSLAGSNEEWTLNGSPTAIAAADALRVSVTLTSPDTFTGSVSSLTQPVGTFSLNAPLIGTAGVEIDSLRFRTSGTGSSSDGARELFFDNLKLTGVVPEPTTALLITVGGLALGFGRTRRS